MTKDYKTATISTTNMTITRSVGRYPSESRSRQIMERARQEHVPAGKTRLLLAIVGAALLVWATAASQRQVNERFGAHTTNAVGQPARSTAFGL